MRGWGGGWGELRLNSVKLTGPVGGSKSSKQVCTSPEVGTLPGMECKLGAGRGEQSRGPQGSQELSRKQVLESLQGGSVGKDRFATGSDKNVKNGVWFPENQTPGNKSQELCWCHGCPCTSLQSPLLAEGTPTPRFLWRGTTPGTGCGW